MSSAKPRVTCHRHCESVGKQQSGTITQNVYDVQEFFEDYSQLIRGHRPQPFA
jgi:hypothetical protein